MPLLRSTCQITEFIRNEPRSSRDRERPLRYSHSEDQRKVFTAAQDAESTDLHTLR